MRTFFSVLFFGTCVCVVHAQSTDIFLENLARDHGFTGQDMEEMLHSRKNINSATRDDLEIAGFLTPYQIASLLDHRERYGLFFSWAEIFLIPGFTGEVSDLLPLFFTLEQHKAPRKTDLRSLARYGKHTVLMQTRTRFPRAEEYSPVTAREYLARPNTRYLGIPWYRYGRYAFSYYDRLRCGITLESDPGERAVADFLSFHISLQGPGALKSLVAGDFRARFGQGLMLWNGTRFGKASSTSSLCNNEMGLTPYTSRDENLFFRGVGATFRHRYFELSVFASARALDARITDEGFTSLVTTGYHRTPLETEKKNALFAWAAGANLSCTGEGWKAGVTALGYGYDRQDAGKITYYNAYKNRSVPFGGISADFSLRWRSLRFFSETAVDAGFVPAVLAGILCYGRNGNRAGVLLRCFSPSFTTAYGAALGRNSTSSNEFSLQLTGDLVLQRSWKLDGSLWFWLFPKARYLCREPSYGWEGRVQLYSGDQMISLRQQRSLSDKGVTDRQSLRLQCGLPLNGLLGLRFRADGVHCLLPGKVNDWGYAVYAEMTCGGAGKKFGGSFRVSYFNTGSWDSRIYMYESDVLYGFSVPALYGKGFRSYINMRYAPFQSLDLWVRFACTAGGSFSCESKVQVRFRF